MIRPALLATLLLTFQTQTDVPDGLRKIIPPVPTPSSFISDAPHVLSDSSHTALDARIRAVHRLGERDDDASLDAGQQVEERLKSVDYDAWECVCGEQLVLPYPALFSSYSKCRECHRRTAKSKREVLQHATTSSSGSARDTYTCQNCGASWVVHVTLPKISESSSSSGGGGGGDGGGSSFGGSGSSSGGGGGGSY